VIISEIINDITFNGTGSVIRNFESNDCYKNNTGTSNFNNTKLDLDDCIEALENRNISSEAEKTDAKSMLLNFLEFAHNEGIIDNFDREKVDEIIQESEDKED